jgi:hypothetical protein
MKKILIMVAGFILPLAIFAQDTPFSAVFDKYVGKKGYESTEIIPSQISMEWEAETSTDEIRKVMDKISSVRIISTEGKKIKSMWKSVSDAVTRADYTELLTVKTGDESVNMYGLKLDNGNMREFALTVKGDDEAILVTLTGDMDMSDIVFGDVIKDMMKLKEQYKGQCPDK